MEGLMKKTIYIGVILGLVLLLLLPACASQSSTPPAKSTTSAGEPQYGGILTILNGTGPALAAPWEADPLFERGAWPVLENLVTNDDSEHIQPLLAESWKIAPDNKSITFSLRKGIKFQDGTDFNAAAVKYNLDAWPKGSAGSAALTQVSSIEALDPYTVRFNLKQFDALLMLQLAQTGVGMISSPTAAQKPTTDANRPVDHCVGTGSFKLIEDKRDITARYQKYDGYWQKGRPYLDGIIMKVVADANTRNMVFQNGEAQYLGSISFKDAASYKAKGNTADPILMGNVVCILADGANKDSPFADVKVRQAVEYAIDKQTLCSTLFAGYNKPANQQTLAEDAYNVKDIPNRDYNVNKAKQLLADAGYPNGLKTTLHVDTRGIKDLQIAVQSYLKDAGIDAELDMSEPARYTQMATTGWKGLLMPGFGMVTNLASLTSRFGTSGYFPSMYRPSGFQDMWNAVLAQPDDVKRVAQVQQIMKTMADQSMTCPIYQNHTIDVTNGKIHNMNWTGRRNMNYWDPVNVWLSN
jgi:peptide/nickel transport system substrate-binding protein